MPITVVTPPTFEPITLREAKEHLRVIGTHEDALIESCITTAREVIEASTTRAICTQTMRMTMDYLPRDCITLPRPPVQSVASIKYIDTAGNQQTMDMGDYTVDLDAEPARIVRAYGRTWPIAREQPGGVTVEFVAGWTQDNMPERVKHLCKLLVAHYYEHREPVIIGGGASEIPMSARSLMRQLEWGAH